MFMGDASHSGFSAENVFSRNAASDQRGERDAQHLLQLEFHGYGVRLRVELLLSDVYIKAASANPPIERCYRC